MNRNCKHNNNGDDSDAFICEYRTSYAEVTSHIPDSHSSVKAGHLLSMDGTKRSLFGRKFFAGQRIIT